MVGLSAGEKQFIKGRISQDLCCDGRKRLHYRPISIEVGVIPQVGRHYIVDATPEEESQMSPAVSVSVNRHGHICGLTKRGGVGLDPIVILDMISVAVHVSQQLIAEIDSEISAAEAALS